VSLLPHHVSFASHAALMPIKARSCLPHSHKPIKLAASLPSYHSTRTSQHHPTLPNPTFCCCTLTTPAVPCAVIPSNPPQAGHVRRFFFIDTQLSRSTASGSDAGTQAVVYPSQMSLLLQIQPDARNRIRPPLLTLK